MIWRKRGSSRSESKEKFNRRASELSGVGIRHFSIFCTVLFSLSFFLTTLLFCACGLDTYYVMDRAPIVERRPDYTESDNTLLYFDFYAAQNSNVGNSEFRFLGTYVYYKIYSNASTMRSNHNSIEAVNNSTNYSAAAERMLSLGYQELNTDGGSRSPLVAASDGPAHVRIRLTNYLETGSNGIENKAQIEIAGIQVGIPRRSRGLSYSFDFGRKDKSGYDSNIRYDHPESGDDDFSGSAPSDDKYYVDMYAVAAGRDTTFTNYYSNVTYLGSITIDANTEKN